MNWKLILQLSCLGLFMAVGAVFFIGPSVEPVLWVIILVVSAMEIARRSGGRFFTHGVFTGLANSVWVTGAHILFVDRYLAWHPAEAAQLAQLPLPDSPRLMMLAVGPAVGLISGGIIGIFAVVAGRLVKK